jgi:hypothetical protein
MVAAEGNVRPDRVTIGVCVMEKKVRISPFQSLVFVSFLGDGGSHGTRGDMGAGWFLISFSNRLSLFRDPLFNLWLIDRLVFLLFQRVRLDWPALASGFLKECGGSGVVFAPEYVPF